jgi:hypothetical protein
MLAMSDGGQRCQVEVSSREFVVLYKAATGEADRMRGVERNDERSITTRGALGINEAMPPKIPIR